MARGVRPPNPPSSHRQGLGRAHLDHIVADLGSVKYQAIMARRFRRSYHPISYDHELKQRASVRSSGARIVQLKLGDDDRGVETKTRVEFEGLKRATSKGSPWRGEEKGGGETNLSSAWNVEETFALGGDLERA
nr:hypothetical protein Iba_chr03dCG0990 [Ipomoea batatas]GMC77691.1 hypothetical protein Iba_chr03fCG0930 [Ipomoea batatas]